MVVTLIDSRLSIRCLITFKKVTDRRAILQVRKQYHRFTCRHHSGMRSSKYVYSPDAVNNTLKQKVSWLLFDHKWGAYEAWNFLSIDQAIGQSVAYIDVLLDDCTRIFVILSGYNLVCS
jgi:hypothetical protein